MPEDILCALCGLIEAMLEKIQTVLSGKCRLNPQEPILVGVSGGPDSLCLLDLLHRAGYRVIVAHFNHKLRPEAEIEARAVEETARQMTIPFVVESADVQLHAQKEKLSLEEAARNLRYHFLFTQAHRYNAQAVAVGHTADDQVETVLMHFVRGAGLNGLKGMSYRTLLPAFDEQIPIVRPLLDAWRTEIVDYCTSHNLNPHYDASNDSPDFLRNRLRHGLIPTLETYNPRFREAAWRTAQTLSSDQDLLAEALESWWHQSVLQETNDYVMLDLEFLARHSAGLQRQLLRRAAQQLLPSEEVIYSVLERASSFIAEAGRLRMDLTGGLILLREGNMLYVARPGTEIPFDLWPQMPAGADSILITPPAQVSLPNGWEFSSENWQAPDSSWEESSRNEDRFRVWLDAEGSQLDQLELRARRPGDRFEPLGLKGHSQKLSDFFTNAKLPQRARERWPILCSGESVIWVPGYRPAEKVKLKRSSQSILYFELTHSLGKAEK
jgi:tRNA(Ile)-lysidine synthase